jgi:hypothetical protein
MLGTDKRFSSVILKSSDFKVVTNCGYENASFLSLHVDIYGHTSNVQTKFYLYLKITVIFMHLFTYNHFLVECCAFLSVCCRIISWRYG